MTDVESKDVLDLEKFNINFLNTKGETPLFNCLPTSKGSHRIIINFLEKINNYSKSKEEPEIPAFKLLNKLGKLGGDSVINALSIGVSFCETCSQTVKDAEISSSSKANAAFWISSIVAIWCAGKNLNINVKFDKLSETNFKLIGSPAKILTVEQSEKLVNSLLHSYNLHKTSEIISAICAGSNDNSTVGNINKVVAISKVLLTSENITSVQVIVEDISEGVKTCCFPIFGKKKKEEIEPRLSKEKLVIFTKK